MLKSSPIGARRLRRALLFGALLAAASLRIAPAALAATHRGSRRRVASGRRTSRASAREHRVLRVGTYEGIAGEYTSIQEAVDAAKPGDWVLIGPGDYKQTSAQTIAGAEGDDQAGADVLITTPHIHIRGMNRNTVMIDGTKPGSPECSSAEADQIFGPPEEGAYQGNNGVVVYKASGVTL